jgi:hypothetical protein
MNVVILILVFLISIALLLGISFLLTRRAAFQVINIFRKNNAIGKHNAKTIDDLGLRPLSFTQRMFRPRNYKPQALKVLAEAQIIQVTEEGKFYISEEKLNDFLMKNKKTI